MDFKGVMTELEKMGTEQNRKIYRRHGVLGAQFGVSMADLKTLEKRIKKATVAEERQALARELWASGNYDARVLATKIAEPGETTQTDLVEWAKDIDNYVITDALCDLAVKTPVGKTLADGWLDSEDEWLGRAGWHLMARLALAEPERPDLDFEPYLGRIEAEIHTRKNYVRDAMNNTLIAIGSRSPYLTEKALSAASRIGKVDVDHGETSCKTPDAGMYIQKTVAYRAAKAEKIKVR